MSARGAGALFRNAAKSLIKEFVLDNNHLEGSKLSELSKMILNSKEL